MGLQSNNRASVSSRGVRVLGVAAVILGLVLCLLFPPLGIVFVVLGVVFIVKAGPVAAWCNKSRPASGAALSGSVRFQMTQVIRTDEQVEMLRNGYKENSDHEIFEPDTVWAVPRSKVYHYCDTCCSTILPAVPISEQEALRRGLHRCKKCDWHGTVAPEPCPDFAPEMRPVSRARVEPVDK